MKSLISVPILFVSLVSSGCTLIPSNSSPELPTVSELSPKILEKQTSISIDSPYSDLGLLVSKKGNELVKAERSLDNRVLKPEAVAYKVAIINTTTNNMSVYEGANPTDVVIEAPLMYTREFPLVISQIQTFIESKELTPVDYQITIEDQDGKTELSKVLDRYTLPDNSLILEFNNGWSIPLTDILIAQ